MRNALGQCLLATLLLAGCEDNKLITPPPAAPPAQTAPAQASPPTEAPPPPSPHQHGATGVGDTAPAAERAPGKVSNMPSSSDWERQGGTDAGTASDAGAASREGGPPSGAAKGPSRP